MKSLTSKLTKFFAILMIAGLTASCASVTDATLPEQVDQPNTNGQIEQPELPDPVIFGGDDMEVIIEKPSTEDG